MKHIILVLLISATLIVFDYVFRERASMDNSTSEEIVIAVEETVIDI